MSFWWWSVGARPQAVLATRLKVPPRRLLTEHLQGVRSATKIMRCGAVVRGTDEDGTARQVSGSRAAPDRFRVGRNRLLGSSGGADLGQPQLNAGRCDPFRNLFPIPFFVLSPPTSPSQLSFILCLP